MSQSNALDSTDLAALRADLAALRHDMAELVSHTTRDLKMQGNQAVGQLDDVARAMLGSAADAGEKTAKAMVKTIEEKPVLTILILLAASYAAGRLLFR